MSLTLGAPIAGRVVALADVPDEVFAAGIVGSGLAIVPDAQAGVLSVVAPCDGALVKIHPHAVALQAGEIGVLVHLGIDTVTLHGKGFDLLVADRAEVSAGEVLMRWDVAVAHVAGLPIETPVVAFGQRELDVTPLVELGHLVQPGQALLRVE